MLQLRNNIASQIELVVPRARACSEILGILILRPEFCLARLHQLARDADSVIGARLRVATMNMRTRFCGTP